MIAEGDQRMANVCPGEQTRWCPYVAIYKPIQRGGAAIEVEAITATTMPALSSPESVDWADSTPICQLA